MQQDMSASADADRACAPDGAEPRAASQAEPLVPSAEHTPAPWRPYDDSDSPNHRHSIVAMGKTVAHIYCTKGDEQEDAANARLIAKAPEMGALLLMYGNLECDFGAENGCGILGIDPPGTGGCRGCTTRNILKEAGLL